MQQARGEAAAQGIDGVGAYEDVSCPAMFVVVPGCCCRLVFFPFPPPLIHNPPTSPDGQRLLT